MDEAELVVLMEWGLYEWVVDHEEGPRAYLERLVREDRARVQSSVIGTPVERGRFPGDLPLSGDAELAAEA